MFCFSSLLFLFFGGLKKWWIVEGFESLEYMTLDMQYDSGKVVELTQCDLTHHRIRSFVCFCAALVVIHKSNKNTCYMIVITLSLR